jgi:hypothetical protein
MTREPFEISEETDKNFESEFLDDEMIGLDESNSGMERVEQSYNIWEEDVLIEEHENGEELTEYRQISSDISMADKGNKMSSEEDNMFTYTCHICHVNFPRMCFLSNHTRKEHDCLPQVACTCGRYLATWDSLMAHKRKHSLDPRNWLCDLCNTAFLTKMA